MANENNCSITRRTALKKSAGVAAVLSTGAVGSASASEAGTQDSKAHYIRFEPDGGSGQWDCRVPDASANTENFEGDDSIRRYSDYAEANGSVNPTFSPKYDEIQFDGDLANLEWSADATVRVIVDGTVKQT